MVICGVVGTFLLGVDCQNKPLELFKNCVDHQCKDPDCENPKEPQDEFCASVEHGVIEGKERKQRGKPTKKRKTKGPVIRAEEIDEDNNQVFKRFVLNPFRQSIELKTQRIRETAKAEYANAEELVRFQNTKQPSRPARGPALHRSHFLCSKEKREAETVIGPEIKA